MNSDASITNQVRKHMHSNDEPTIDPDHDDVLVVLEPEDPATLRAAMRDYDPAETTFHLLQVVPTREFEARRRAFAEAGVPRDYSLPQAEERARRAAARIGREFIDRDADGYRATGAVGRHRDQIHSYIGSHAVEKIYVPEEDASLWDRLIGGGTRASRIAKELPEGISVDAVESAGGPVGGSSGSGTIPGPGGEPASRSP